MSYSKDRFVIMCGPNGCQVGMEGSSPSARSEAESFTAFLHAKGDGYEGDFNDWRKDHQREKSDDGQQ